MDTSPRPKRCPECEGERLSWSVHRTGTRAQRHSPRELHWACRGCGHAWSEPASAPEETAPLAAPAV